MHTAREEKRSRQRERDGEGARQKMGEADKWRVTEGSAGLKINMIRRKT